MNFAAIRRLLPTARDYTGLREGWHKDLVAGVTVGVVALPLALAFGIASGLGAAAGLATAVVAGVIAGVFGGSNLQVSGPTGAMAVILAPIVAQQGIAGVAIVTLLAGLVLMIAAAAKLGRFVTFLPWPVIEGFTVGIGLIIFLQQVPAALGVEPSDSTNAAVRAIHGVLDLGAARWQSIVVVAVTAGLMLVLPRIHRSIPASLIAIAAVTVLAEIAAWPVESIGAIPSSLPSPKLPAVDLAALPHLGSAVLAIAALAAIESLLSARVADGMSDEERHDPDRELFGQGLASVGSSFFGGMPATGAIARTAVNVRAGGRTRAAAVAHALLILLAMVALAPMIARIPLAALAGVLMVTAFHMLEFGVIGRVLRSTRGDAVVLVATASATVAFDLVVAVELGVVLAGMSALHQVVKASSYDRDDLTGVDIDSQTEHELLDRHVVAYQLDGALFFGVAQRFLLELADVSDVDVVILRFGNLKVLDATGAQVLGDLVVRLRKRGITVLFACVRREHRELIKRVGVLDELDHDGQIVPTIDEALDYVRRRFRNQSDRDAGELAVV